MSVRNFGFILNWLKPQRKPETLILHNMDITVITELPIVAGDVLPASFCASLFCEFYLFQ